MKVTVDYSHITTFVIAISVYFAKLKQTVNMALEDSTSAPARSFLALTGCAKASVDRVE